MEILVLHSCIYWENLNCTQICTEQIADYTNITQRLIVCYLFTSVYSSLNLKTFNFFENLINLSNTVHTISLKYRKELRTSFSDNKVRNWLRFSLVDIRSMF